MRHPRRSTLAALVVLGALAMLGRTLVARPRILVLHSFAEDSPWVRGVDAGIRSALAANRRPVSVSWHYMGLDRRAGAEERRVAAADARREVGLLAPDLLVAVDDESNELVGREVAAGGRSRVLYVSIDRAPGSYGYRRDARATGVVERLPLRGVREAISAIREDRPVRIVALAADGETGRAELAQARAFDWSPHRLVAADAVATFEDWQARVGASAGDSDVLLVLSTGGLGRGAASGGVLPAEVVSEADVARWTEAHAGPLPIGTRPDWVAAGGSLSIAPPAAPVGRLAIEMGLDWLDERGGAEPPEPRESSHFDVALDEGRLRARAVELPRIWVEAARVRDAARP